MTTTTSTKLTQVQQYVWYGTCESEMCSDELFDEWGSKFSTVRENIVEISTYEEGVLKTYRPGYGDGGTPYPNPGPGVGELDRFKCGYMYSITLTKNGQIEMDNMYPSNSNSISNKYGVSSTCSALGDVGLSCIPEGFTAFYYKDSNQEEVGDDGDVVSEVLLEFEEVDGVRQPCGTSDGEATCEGYGNFWWNAGGQRDPNSYFSLDVSKLDPKIDEGDSAPISFNLYVGNEANSRAIGYLNLQTRPTEHTEIHFYENGTCYKGELNATEADQNEQIQGEEDVYMEEVWSSSAMCTFENPDDAEGEPIVYQSFEVGPNFNDVTTGNIRPSGFQYQGDLRVPPTGEASDDDFRLGIWFMKNGEIDIEAGEIGSITYVKCMPKISISSDFGLGVYFFAKTGSFTGKCLFGTISGEKCYLGE